MDDVLRAELLERDEIIFSERIRQLRRRSCRNAVENAGVRVEVLHPIDLLVPQVFSFKAYLLNSKLCQVSTKVPLLISEEVAESAVDKLKVGLKCKLQTRARRLWLPQAFGDRPAHGAPFVQPLPRSMEGRVL